MTSEYVGGLWSSILDHLAERHPADFRHLLRINLEGVRNGRIVLSGTPTAVEAWDDRHRLERLAGAASEVLGGRVEFEFEARSSRRLTARREEDGGRLAGELTRHPAVGKINSLFEGVIVHCETAAIPEPETTCSYVEGDSEDAD